MNMYRNLFAVFATLALGTGAASAATPASPDQSLEQRVLAAQQAIGSVLTGTESPTAKAGAEQHAQYYWRNYFRNYFPNYFRNYYGG
jgi:hypothetical protein